MAGWFDFVNGQTLPAGRVQDYLMDQAVMVFADSTARGTALPTPNAGMVTYLVSTQALEYFDGTNWQPVSPPPPGTKNLDQFLLMGA